MFLTLLNGTAGMTTHRYFLFLDFDGVLHPCFPRSNLSYEQNQLFSCLPRLERVLREFADVELVISSSWRLNQPLERLAQHFSADIRTRIIGVTPLIDSRWPPYPPASRYAEIQLFLQQCHLKDIPWMALDDDAKLFPECCTQLILCSDGFWEREELALRQVVMQRGKELSVSGKL